MQLNEDNVNHEMALKAAKISKAAALRMSERKWESLVYNQLSDNPGGKDYTGNTCSLCLRYNVVNTYGVILEGCQKCPLFKQTGMGCGYSEGSFHKFCESPSPKTALAILNDIRAISKKEPLKVKDFK